GRRSHPAWPVSFPVFRIQQRHRTKEERRCSFLPILTKRNTRLPRVSRRRRSTGGPGLLCFAAGWGRATDHPRNRQSGETSPTSHPFFDGRNPAHSEG